MMMTGTPRSAASSRHVRVALQAPDVVEDGGALIERPGATSALMVSIETGTPSLTTAGSTGLSRASSSSSETGFMPA